MKMMVTKKIKMKMINSIEKSSSLNCSLFPERERERGPVQPIKLSTEKTTKQSTKKKGGAYILDYLL